ADAYQVLGGVYVRKGNYKSAAAAYEKYLAQKDSDVMVRLELARAYRTLAEDGDAEAQKNAVREYERIMKDAAGDAALTSVAEEEVLPLKYPGVGTAFLEGKTAYVRGDFREAVKKLEKVVKKEPQIEEAQYLLGMAYASPQVKRRADAMAAWEKA